MEDACEAIGAEYRGVRVGCGLSQWSDRPIRHAACFGFYPNKQMTTGEGGIIVTQEEQWADRFRSLRNQGRDVFDAWLRHSRIGFNYRMDELSAALGVVQTCRLDDLLARRARVAEIYGNLIEQIDGARPLTVASSTTRMSWFVYVVRLDPSVERDRLMKRLRKRGIPSRPYFSPIHLQPAYRELFGFQEGMFPNAEAAGRQLLALPFFGTMRLEQIELVCTHLAAELARE